MKCVHGVKALKKEKQSREWRWQTINCSHSKSFSRTTLLVDVDICIPCLLAKLVNEKKYEAWNM